MYCTFGSFCSRVPFEAHPVECPEPGQGCSCIVCFALSIENVRLTVSQHPALNTLEQFFHIGHCMQACICQSIGCCVFVAVGSCMRCTIWLGVCVFQR